MDESLLTNREAATLLILGGLSVFVLTRPGRAGLLEAFSGVLRSLGSPKLLIPLVLYVAWVSIAAAGAARLGIWDLGLLKTTIVWLVLTGTVLVMRLPDAIRKPGYFRSALIKTLGVAAVVEFLASLKSFPLLLEIPAQALACVFAGVAVLAERDARHSGIHKMAIGYLAIFGLSALVWSVAHLVANWSSLDHAEIAREFLFPVWMTPVALLYVYVFAVVTAYESCFVHMRISRGDEPLRAQRLAVILRANGWLATLRHLNGPGAHRIAMAGSFRQAWRVIGDLCTEERQRRAEEVATQRRLAENAGVIGTDDRGRQLDRREFKETCSALHGLATCQMGHYRNRGEQYRDDLLPIVAPHFEHDGLPPSHGVEIHVSPDGQSWYATRQTITRWWFAIGAAGPPPDLWLYDGPVPPDVFPSEPQWDRFGGGSVSVNWD